MSDILLSLSDDSKGEDEDMIDVSVLSIVVIALLHFFFHVDEFFFGNGCRPWREVIQCLSLECIYALCMYCCYKA